MYVLDSINSNILYIPPRFSCVQQLEISKIYTLFQPIKLQLSIKHIICDTYTLNLKILAAYIVLKRQSFNITCFSKKMIYFKNAVEWSINGLILKENLSAMNPIFLLDQFAWPTGGNFIPHARVLNYG